MRSLAGKTVFISGASRGIGLAIALRAAREGANIVVTGKTAAPHAKLPGTVYTAAADIEAAGGKALPVILDIRFEDQVYAAVAQAVQRFGGIDILINNASAISLTSTLDESRTAYETLRTEFYQVEKKATTLEAEAEKLRIDLELTHESNRALEGTRL